MTAKRHIHLGDQLAWTDKDLEGGLAEYRKAIELDPTLEIAHWCIGQVHFFAEPPRIEEAIQAFREAIRLKPTWSESHFSLGLAFLQKKSFYEALPELKAAISLSETDDERLFIPYGECLYELGKFGEAVKAFRKGIELSRTEEISYRHWLANSLFGNREIKAARLEWRRVVEMRSNFQRLDDSSGLKDEFYSELEREMEEEHLFKEKLVAEALRKLDETSEFKNGPPQRFQD